jgi:hypothetical protein
MTSYHNAKRPDKAKANRVLERAGYKSGGSVGDGGENAGFDAARTLGQRDASTIVKQAQSTTPNAFKRGVRVKGEKPKDRLDRKARGGKVSNPMGEAHKVTEFPKKKLNKEPEQVDSEGMKKYDDDGYARGGRAKGKAHTHVNIQVGGGQQGAGDAQQAFKAGVLQGAQAAKAAIAGGVQHGAPMMPPGGGMPPGGAPAPGGMPPGGAPMPPRPMPGAMPGGPPPMMRKSGGRVGTVGHPVGGTLPLARAMNSGSGGAKGRLTKAGFYQGKKKG